MHSPLEHIEPGATIVAAGNRLARVLTESYTAQQRLNGKSVWKSPSILSWGAFLAKLWREALVTSAGPLPLLLNAAQELSVWEDVIAESAEGRALLQISATAQKAMDAWDLIHAYRLRIRAGQFTVSEDCTAFLNWEQEFERRCTANAWMEQARLAGRIADLLAEKKLSVPAPVYLAGFDEFTPQQIALIEAVGDTRQLSSASAKATPVCLALNDTSDELLQAAAWARERLERNADANIGIVVPNLERLRSRADRIFASVFHPGLDRQAVPSFHISLGVPLSDTPVVRAALLVLELGAADGTHNVRLSRLGMLLRGPFLAGAEREQSQRALLDARLRKKGLFRVNAAMVREAVIDCPSLESALRGIEKLVEHLSGSRTPSEWSRTFSRLLREAGWPGDRTLSSQEYQTVRAWNDLLSRFSTLDVVTGGMIFATALEKLSQLAGTTLFQAEDPGARVQVMGLFESSGLRFDHLWVTGLHDEALPSASRPNPFLPLELQRTNRLPHSSPARELEVAHALMRRLRESADEIVFSYPTQEGDQRLGPSPLLEATAGSASARSVPTWLDAMKSTAVLEELIDSYAPAVPEDRTQEGGTWLLRDMAACPFRAWAQNRAGARPLDEPELGISSRESGTAVHKTLELIWKELQTHRALCALPPEQLRALTARCVREALSPMTGLGRMIEQRRLERLIAAWLETEKRRLPFTVIKAEEKQPIAIGGLRLQTRIDRLDELEDGRHIILDYKTGEVKPSCWTGDRPDEPQLLVYTVTHGDAAGGAAFAQIRAGKIGFHGITADPVMLPGMKNLAVKGVGFDDQIREWRMILERLAADFLAGKAEVNPKQHACDYCGFTALCRVQDVTVD